MDINLTAMIIEPSNSVIERYAKTLSDFGYEIIKCPPEPATMISTIINNDCDIVLSSHDDIETEEYLRFIVFFNDKKERPFIVDITLDLSLTIKRAISSRKYIKYMQPIFEDKAIFLFIEKYQDFSSMSTEKLFYLLRLKTMFDCKYIGLDPGLKGFKWIYESAFIIIANPVYKKNFSSGVYKILQKRYNVKYTQIEPSVRRSIADMTHKISGYIKKYYFGIEENDEFDLTTMEVINKISDNVSKCFFRNSDEFYKRSQRERNRILWDFYNIEL